MASPFDELTPDEAIGLLVALHDVTQARLVKVCATCEGTKEITLPGPFDCVTGTFGVKKVVCTTCGGSGLRKDPFAEEVLKLLVPAPWIRS